MSLIEQINAIEAGLGRLGKHVPDLPQNEILAARLLVHVGRELTNLLDQRLKPHGLGEIEYRTLMNVFVHTRHQQVAYPGELCSSLGQSPANITRLTDSLVQRGLIVREPDAHDRRKLGLRTTAQGDQLVSEVLPVMLQTVRANFSSMPQTDLQDLINILKRLATALDQQAEADK